MINICRNSKGCSLNQALRSLFLVAVLLTLAGILSASAEDLIWATGRVLTADKQPLSGATIAIYDDSNKVVDFARTDKNGYYAIAVPKRVMHLDKHTKGFMSEMVGGVGHFIGGAAGFVANPLRAGVRVATAAEASAFVDPITKGGIAVGGAVADSVLFGISPHEKKTQFEERKQPGCMLIKVVMPGSTDLVGVGKVYWLQQETYKAGGKQDQTLAAWLDPIELTKLDSEKNSNIDSSYLRFTAARLEPSIVQPGQKVRIHAKMSIPPTPEIQFVVVARDSRTGEKWELHAAGNGIFEGEIEISKKFPRDDQVISIVAYAGLQQHPGRRDDAEHAIESSHLWDPKKTFLYDPLLVVSRNRADLILTVLASPK